MMTSRTREEGPGEVTERRFQIHGKVQGVGFRWWTWTQAQRLGVTGSVRNRSDGSVEVLACGAEEALERFAEVLRQGAPGSRVSGVDQEDAEGVSRTSFEIVH
jgi:acylphosphatase